jgi:ribonuclease HII
VDITSIHLTFDQVTDEVAVAYVVAKYVRDELVAYSDGEYSSSYDLRPARWLALLPSHIW